ncbi:hypothetical protein PFISCL1PPCAC_19423, partial [Pristionchus fissidentatus]
DTNRLSINLLQLNSIAPRQILASISYDDPPSIERAGKTDHLLRLDGVSLVPEGNVLADGLPLAEVDGQKEAGGSVCGVRLSLVGVGEGALHKSERLHVVHLQ